MTPKQFYDDLRTHLSSRTPGYIPVTIGEAPPNEVLDYVVIWPSPGTALEDRPVDGLMGNEATLLDFQITAVSNASHLLLQLMQDLNRALTDTKIGGHLIRPDTVANRATRPLQDETRRPVRHYLVTTWHTTLTRQRSTNAE